MAYAPPPLPPMTGLTLDRVLLCVTAESVPPVTADWGRGGRGGDVKTTTPSETVNCPFKDRKQRGSNGALQQ